MLKKLPKTDNEYGYTAKKVDKILKALNIPANEFWEAFGVNTCAVDGKTNKVIYYKHDIERTLYCLGHTFGVHHLWD